MLRDRSWSAYIFPPVMSCRTCLASGPYPSCLYDHVPWPSSLSLGLPGVHDQPEGMRWHTARRSGSRNFRDAPPMCYKCRGSVTRTFPLLEEALPASCCTRQHKENNRGMATSPARASSQRRKKWRALGKRARKSDTRRLPSKRRRRTPSPLRLPPPAPTRNDRSPSRSWSPGPERTARLPQVSANNPERIPDSMLDGPRMTDLLRRSRLAQQS